MERYCDWERRSFGEDEFSPFRGNVYLHFRAAPVHLTTGELPDEQVDVAPGASADIGHVEIGYAEAPEADEE